MVTDWRALLGALAVPLAPVVFTLGAIQEPQDCGAWWRWWRRRACVRASGGGGERPSAQSAMQTTRRGLSPLSACRAMLRGLNCTREGTEPALRWRLSEGNSPALRCASQVGQLVSSKVGMWWRDYMHVARRLQVARTPAPPPPLVVRNVHAMLQVALVHQGVAPRQRQQLRRVAVRLDAQPTLVLAAVVLGVSKVRNWRLQGAAWWRRCSL